MKKSWVIFGAGLLRSQKKKNKTKPLKVLEVFCTKIFSDIVVLCGISGCAHQSPWLCTATRCSGGTCPAGAAPAQLARVPLSEGRALHLRMSLRGYGGKKKNLLGLLCLTWARHTMARSSGAVGGGRFLLRTLGLQIKRPGTALPRSRTTSTRRSRDSSQGTRKPTPLTLLSEPNLRGKQNPSPRLRQKRA